MADNTKLCDSRNIHITCNCDVGKTAESWGCETEQVEKVRRVFDENLSKWIDTHSGLNKMVALEAGHDATVWVEVKIHGIPFEI